MRTFRGFLTAVNEHKMAMLLWLELGMLAALAGFFIYPSFYPDIQVLLTFVLAELITLKPLIRILKKPK